VRSKPGRPATTHRESQPISAGSSAPEFDAHEPQPHRRPPNDLSNRQLRDRRCLLQARPRAFTVEAPAAASGWDMSTAREHRLGLAPFEQMTATGPPSLTDSLWLALPCPPRGRGREQAELLRPLPPSSSQDGVTSAALTTVEFVSWRSGQSASVPCATARRSRPRRHPFSHSHRAIGRHRTTCASFSQRTRATRPPAAPAAAKAPRPPR
jgi:hypothetical protein